MGLAGPGSHVRLLEADLLRRETSTGKSLANIRTYGNYKVKIYIRPVIYFGSKKGFLLISPLLFEDIDSPTAHINDHRS
jgi:hypothetical protein